MIYLKQYSKANMTQVITDQEVLDSISEMEENDDSETEKFTTFIDQEYEESYDTDES